MLFPLFEKPVFQLILNLSHFAVKLFGSSSWVIRFLQQDKLASVLQYSYNIHHSRTPSMFLTFTVRYRDISELSCRSRAQDLQKSFLVRADTLQGLFLINESSSFVSQITITASLIFYDSTSQCTSSRSVVPRTRVENHSLRGWTKAHLHRLSKAVRVKVSWSHHESQEKLLHRTWQAFLQSGIQILKEETKQGKRIEKECIVIEYLDQDVQEIKKWREWGSW